MTDSSDRLRIVLSNSYGTLNVGDEAILTVLVRELVGRGHSVDVLTFTPGATGARQPGAITIHSGVLRGSLATLNAIRKADLLLVGGGGIIQDSTSLGNLLFHLSRTWMARLVGTPYVLSGVGIGPLRRSISRRLVAAACRRARSISVRDRQSAALLAEIGVAPDRIEVTADLAHLLPNPDTQMDGVRATIDSLGKQRNEGRQLIGLSLRPPVGDARQRLANTAEFETTMQVAAEVANCLVAEHAAHIVFVSMHPDQDDAIATQLQSCMHDRKHYTVIPGHLPPGAIKSIITELDLLIGTRLHSIIFATCGGVPSIGLAYDAKVAAYLASLGLSKQVLEPPDWQTDRVLKLALDSLIQSAAIRDELDRGVPELMKLAKRSIADAIVG